MLKSIRIFLVKINILRIVKAGQDVPKIYGKVLQFDNFTALYAIIFLHSAIKIAMALIYLFNRWRNRKTFFDKISIAIYQEGYRKGVQDTTLHKVSTEYKKKMKYADAQAVIHDIRSAIRN